MTFKPHGVFDASLLTILFSCAIAIVVFGVVLLFIPHPHTVAQTTPQTPTLALNPSLLQAQAAVVYDPATGAVLFEKDANEPLPLASLTKLFTAQTILAEQPTVETITITKADLLQQDEADLAFHAGDTFSFTHLLQVALIGSSNDAMAAVAASVGPDTVARMNMTASQLGLTNSVFYNPTGLDVSSTTSGGYASAKDVAVLASTFYRQHPDYFELTEHPTVTVPGPHGTLLVPATDTPLLNIPNLIGAKTGYTTLAGGNLVAIFDVGIGHPLVAVVLHSTEKGRFNDIQTLIRTAQETL